MAISSINWANGSRSKQRISMPPCIACLPTCANSTTAAAGMYKVLPPVRTGSRGESGRAWSPRATMSASPASAPAFPAIDDALRRGEVSYSKVRTMLRAATPENETLLLEYARLMTAAQLEKLTR